MVFPLSKLIFIYQPIVSLDGISSFQTYIYLPTICLPRWYFLCPNLYSFTQQSSTSVVFPLSKPLFIYRPLIYLDGSSSTQTYINLPTTVSLDGSSSTQTYIILPTTCLPRWYFLYLNLYSFTNHLSTSMVFPLSKNIFIYRPLSPLMVVPVSKLIFIYQPLSPLMVVPLPKLIFIYRPLIYLNGISSTQTYINLPTTVSLGGISSIQTYIHLPTTYLPRWYFLYPNLYSFTNHLSPSVVFPLFKLIFIYQPLVYLDGISCIQTYIILPTTCLPRWYFLYLNIYSFTDHCLP